MRDKFDLDTEENDLKGVDNAPEIDDLDYLDEIDDLDDDIYDDITSEINYDADYDLEYEKDKTSNSISNDGKVEKSKSKNLPFFEGICATLICVSLFIIVAVWFSSGGILGQNISSSLKGIFGIGAYLLPILVIVGVAFTFKTREISLRNILLSCLAFLLFVILIHILRGVSSGGNFTNYSAYISNQYKSGGISNGGVIGAVIGGTLSDILGKFIATLLIGGCFLAVIVLIFGSSFFIYLLENIKKFSISSKDNILKSVEKNKKNKEEIAEKNKNGILHKSNYEDKEAEEENDKDIEVEKERTRYSRAREDRKKDEPKREFKRDRETVTDEVRKPPEYGSSKSISDIEYKQVEYYRENDIIVPKNEDKDVELRGYKEEHEDGYISNSVRRYREVPRPTFFSIPEANNASEEPRKKIDLAMEVINVKMSERAEIEKCNEQNKELELMQQNRSVSRVFGSRNRLSGFSGKRNSEKMEKNEEDKESIEVDDFDEVAEVSELAEFDGEIFENETENYTEDKAKLNDKHYEDDIYIKPKKTAKSGVNNKKTTKPNSSNFDYNIKKKGFDVELNLGNKEELEELLSDIPDFNLSDEDKSKLEKIDEFYDFASKNIEEVEEVNIATNEEVIQVEKEEQKEQDFDEQMETEEVISYFDEVKEEIRDKLTDEVLDFVLDRKKISIMKIQRQFKIGRNRAMIIMLELEDIGIIGGGTGKSKNVIINREEYEKSK